MKSLVVGLCAALISQSEVATAAPGLTVRPGEAWIFRLDHGQPADARKVTEDAAPAAEELKVELKPYMGTMMMITNNTQKFYDYHAFLIRDDGDLGSPTSVCTLMSGGRAGIENWPDTVAAIRIADFSEAKVGQMMCR